MKTKLYTLIAVLALIIGVGIFSCSTGKDATLTGGETGSVAILLTDGPSCDFDSIEVTITKIELLSEDSKVTVFESDPGETVDLLLLDGVAVPFTIADVPAGTYNKIRLHVTDPVLKKADADDIHPKLPGNGKLDLNPRMQFSVEANETLLVQLDFDGKKSVQTVKTGNDKCIFRPVVFVKVLSGIFPESTDKFIKTSGIVSSKGDNSFLLCDFNTISPVAMRFAGDVRDLCIDVSVQNASFFDEDGFPITFGDIADDDFVTVIGRLHSGSPTSGDIPPISYIMGLDAIVVGKGELVKLDGTILSSLDTDRQFEFAVDTAVEGIPDTNMTVQYLDATQIHTPAGDILDSSFIMNGTTASIYGVVSPSDGIVHAAFISIPEPSEQTELSGYIFDNPNRTERTFDLDTGTSIVCVTVPVGAAITEIVSYGSGQMINENVSFMVLRGGDRVTIQGNFDPGDTSCFIADSLIVYHELAR